MSPEQTPDSPEPSDARAETPAPERAQRAEPAAGAGDTAQGAPADDVTAAGDGEADDAAPAGTASAAEEQPESKKRRRTPRIRKGATGKAEEQQAGKEPRAAQPRARARAGKAAATGAKKAEDSAPATAPAPARRKKPSSSRPRRRVVHARARYVRTSARKARLVCVHLRGKSVAQARAILAFAPRAVARDWSKLLESAVANAENNHELLEEDLIIREAYADEGPTIKRFRPRAMGRATPIRKRTSHLTITLQAGSNQDKRAG